ncbi:MAG: glycine cleavage system protein H [Prolixibacteraceae bacterium]|nr:glycine cleavage system protein H [Prolixibacteraceae bacterium]
MDGFTYKNIFETKGIEYLATIAFFAILIPFWLLLNRQIKTKKQSQKSAGILNINTLKIPQGVFFSKFHTWTHLGVSGVARVGLDDLLLHMIGEVKFDRIKTPGEKIKKGDLLARIEHKGNILKVFSPISGEIMEANPVLTTNPELLNEDPYVKGWLYKIKPISWTADTYSYYLAEDATLFSRQELDKFKEFISASLGKYSPQPSMLILQDGGELLDQPLSGLPPEAWQEFQEDFLGKKTLHRNKGCLRNQENQKKS